VVYSYHRKTAREMGGFSTIWVVTGSRIEQHHNLNSKLIGLSVQLDYLLAMRNGCFYKSHNKV